MNDITATNLARTYAKSFVFVYSLIVITYWVGFEAIYGHVTPFYARFLPAFSDGFIPSHAVLACCCFYLLYAYLGRRGDTAILRWRLPLLAAVLACVWGAYILPGATDWGTVVARTWLRWETVQPHLVAYAAVGAAIALWQGPLGKVLSESTEIPCRRTVLSVVGAMLIFGVFSVAIAATRYGLEALGRPYARTEYEHVGDLHRVRSVTSFLGNYCRIQPELTIHSRVHPPGPLLFYTGLSRVFGLDDLRLGLATLLVGMLGVPLLFFWCRERLGLRAAHTAVWLYVFMPAPVLFAVTSADILFTPFTLLTLFAFERALRTRSALWACLAGAAFFWCTLLKFLLLSLGAYFILSALFHGGRRKDAWTRVLWVGTVMAIVFFGLHIAIRIGTGFDYIESFRIAKHFNDQDRAMEALYAPRAPFWMWKILNPLAWLYFAGIPISVLFGHGVCRGLRAMPRHAAPLQDGSKDVFPVSAEEARPQDDMVTEKVNVAQTWTFPLFLFALTFLAFDALYIGAGEGERAAMYVYPFLAAGAAVVLTAVRANQEWTACVTVTLAFTAMQTWITESYLDTYW
jgi:hypothetical protein